MLTPTAQSPALVVDKPALRVIERGADDVLQPGGALCDRHRRALPAHVGLHPAGMKQQHAAFGGQRFRHGEGARQRVQRAFTGAVERHIAGVVMGETRRGG